MHGVRFAHVDMRVDRQLLLDLNVEYMTWNADQLDAHFAIDTRAMMGGSVREYVEHTIDKVCSDGSFLVAHEADAPIAMGAFRKLRDDVSEIKRMYVRPSHRGLRVGEALLRRLIEEAGEAGARTIVLDSAPFMTTAHRLYRSHGFVDRGEYPETEVPPPLRATWRFMERVL